MQDKKYSLENLLERCQEYFYCVGLTIFEWIKCNHQLTQNSWVNLSLEIFCSTLVLIVQGIATQTAHLQRGSEASQQEHAVYFVQA